MGEPPKVRPKFNLFIARGGFLCTECEKRIEKMPDETYPEYAEVDGYQGHRVCQGCLPKVLDRLAKPAFTPASELSREPGPAPSAVVEIAHGRARVVLRSAYGRVEVEYEDVGQAGEAPEALLDRVGGACRTQFEAQIEASRKAEEEGR